MISNFDVVIVGAGAAGLMCAAVAGRRGRRVAVVDHARHIAEKIRISGGGRCNFTNVYASPAHFLSQNPHFCKSALSRYTPQDFITLLRHHNIAFHEKKLGQMFCDESSQDIIDVLLRECDDAGVTILPETTVAGVQAQGGGYVLQTGRGEISGAALVVATGGLSIPKIGATGFGYDLARQFGLDIVQTRPGLVPLTFTDALLAQCRALSGLSVEAEVSCGKTVFAEGFLFTHRGFSGPSILQISSYWREGNEISVNLAPGTDVLAFLKNKKAECPRQDVQTALSDIVPKRLAQPLCDAQGGGGVRLADCPDKTLAALALLVNGWRVLPAGTEGYRTAEVTLGGVDTNGLSSKTMEARHQPGLYFIGEVVDVTGHLGGFNFQWAWASGHAAGESV